MFWSPSCKVVRTGHEMAAWVQWGQPKPYQLVLTASETNPSVFTIASNMRAWVLQDINWLPSITSLYQYDTTSCILFFRYKIRRVHNDATRGGRETELQKLHIYGYCMDILCDDPKVSSRKGSDTKRCQNPRASVIHIDRREREREWVPLHHW